MDISIQALLRRVDKNHNGIIDKNELSEAKKIVSDVKEGDTVDSAAKKGPAPELKEVLKKIDQNQTVDNNGNVDEILRKCKFSAWA